MITPDAISSDHFPTMTYPTPTTHSSASVLPINEDIDIVQQTPIPPFSHIPPPNIRGRHRWPVALEAQGFPDQQTPTLVDVIIWSNKYLEPKDKLSLKQVAKTYR
jgi:hypothetical protein